MSTNNYVLDTSVLLDYGSEVFKSLDDANLFLPTHVLEDLKEFKDHKTHGKNANRVFNELGRIRSRGNIWDGIEVEGKSVLKLVKPTRNHAFYALGYSDSLESLLSVSTESNATILSSDFHVRATADLHGLRSKELVLEDPHKEFIESVQTYRIADSDFDTLETEGVVRLDLDVPVNAGVILLAGSRSALALSKPGYHFTRIPDMSVGYMKAKTKEQHIAMKQLKDDTIKAVSLGGVAGGGKTAMSLGAGVDALDKNQYKKIVVFRSMQSVGGEELGFLPGDEREKLDPWTAAINDALEGVTSENRIKKLKTDKALEILPITHVRGRTLTNSFIIVDEAQNLSYDTIKTLLTRVSHSSKIVLTHDITQRDNFRVGKLDGIHEVVSRLYGDKLFAHTQMVKSERSELAQTVTRLLD